MDLGGERGDGFKDGEEGRLDLCGDGGLDVLVEAIGGARRVDGSLCS